MVDSSKVTAFISALNNKFENKIANKKNSISGDFSSDSSSYPTVNAVKSFFGTKVNSWSSTTGSESNYPSENLVKTALNDKISKSQTTGLVKNDGEIATSISKSFINDFAHNQATSTITNSTAYNNIKSGESTTLTLDTQAKINDALNTKIGELQGIKFLEITSDKGTASASTMGKLYVEVKNNKTDLYYTSYSNNTYSWIKIDSAILEDVSISWNDVTNKPSFGTGANDFAKGNHTHGILQNDGQVGSTVNANKPVKTDANGKITTGSFGSSSGTFCEGNDDRLYDERNPLVEELQFIENIDDLDFTSFWYIDGGMISNWNSSLNGTLPNVTPVGQSYLGVLFIISSNSATVYNSIKQIFIYDGSSYSRVGSGNALSGITWGNWKKELITSDVDTEIEAYLDAITTALSS